MATRTILNEAIKRHSSDIGEGSIHVIYMMATQSLSTVMMKMAMFVDGDLEGGQPGHTSNLSRNPRIYPCKFFFGRCKFLQI